MTDIQAPVAKTPPIVEQIKQLFAHPPTLRSTALSQAQALLEGWLPGNALTASSVFVGERRRRKLGDGYVAGPYEYQSLTDVLLQRFVDGRLPAFTDSFTLVSSLSSEQHTVLAVSLEREATLINQRGEGLLAAYRQALLDYWMQPLTTGASRWEQFSSLLGQRISLSKAPFREYLSVDLQKPEISVDLYGVRAFCTDRRGERYAEALPVLVFRRTENGEAKAPLLYSLSAGFQALGDQHLADLLPNFMSARAGDHDIEYSEYKAWSIGDALESPGQKLSMGLLENQLESVRQLPWLTGKDVAYYEQQLQLIVDPGGWFTAPAAGQPSSKKHQMTLLTATQAKLRDTLPAWLVKATAPQQMAYRELLLQQAAALQEAQGKTYLDGIEPIQRFAQQALLQKMREDHRAVTTFPDPNDVHLVIREAVFDGPGVPTGTINNIYATLCELAIINLRSWSHKPMTITLKQAGVETAAPEWMTPDYLKKLVTELDIGQRYPDLLKSTFVTDVVESQRREQLYARQIPVQLALQALELSIKGQQGFTDLGRRYVAAIFSSDSDKRRVENQDLVLRRLNINSGYFQEQHSHGKTFSQQISTDYGAVSAMFIIGPRDTQVGPHILYRPLLEDTLREFPTFEGVLDEIKQPGALQDSVLTWMPEAARSVFSNDGFRTPHDKHARQSQAMLDDASITVGALHETFVSTVNALIELGERESESNAERRRTSWKTGIWLMVNTLVSIPFLGMFRFVGPLVGVLGAAMLVYTVGRDLWEIATTSDSKARSEAWMDLLRNLGPVLLALATHRLLLQSAKPAPLLEAPTSTGVREPLITATADLNVPIALEPNVSASAPNSITQWQLKQALSALVEPLGAHTNIDLSEWASNAVLPESLMPDASGLHHHDGTTYLRQGQKTYALAKAPRTGAWHIVRPGTELGDSPLLHTNGVGGWWYGEASPWSWSAGKLFYRLSSEAREVPVKTAERILHATGIDEGVLRKVQVDGEQPPALLVDTLKRFKLDADIQRFIEYRTAGESAAGNLAEQEMQWRLLTQDPRWPSTKVLRVLDKSGWVLHERPANAAATAARLDITTARLMREDVLEVLLPLLDGREQRKLLALTGEADHAQRLVMFRKRLAERAVSQRKELFEAYYTEGEEKGDPDVTLIQNDFKGLPAAIARSLLDKAAPAEREYLREAQRVPLRLAEEAGYYEQEVRLSRVYESLYLQSVSMPEAKAIPFPVAEGETSASIDQSVAKGADALSRAQMRKYLEMPPIDSGFESPMRLANGRMAYPLSIELDQVSSMAESLYPGTPLSEVRRFLGMEEEGELRLQQRLSALRIEYDAMSASLEAWANIRGMISVDADNVRVANLVDRSTAVQRIKDCWRRQTPQMFSGAGEPIGHDLDLSDLDLVDLPPLLGDFSHVGSLTLERTRLVAFLWNSGREYSGALSGFLSKFPRVRWLSLSGNHLTVLPEAIAQMTQLTKLTLSGNRIVLTPDALVRLGAMSTLKLLLLNGNPLTLAPDISNMPALIRLDLSQTDIVAWPIGFEGCEHLVQMDLTFNQLSDIPQTLSGLPAHRLSGVRLGANPWSEQGRATARAIRDQHSITLGLGAADVSVEGPPPAPVAPAVTIRVTPPDALAPWLNDILKNTPTAEQAARRQVWEALKGEPNSRDFFGVLDGLRSSADYLTPQTRPALISRVWRMLRAAAAKSSLRERLFRYSVERDTCADGLSDIFSELGLEVLVDEALNYKKKTSIGQLLVMLARGQARLVQLAEIAQAEVLRQQSQGRRPDEVEVHLAYRVDLGERLRLNWQPQSMMFRGISGVTPQMTEAAYNTVIANERGGQLVNSMLQLKKSFWRDYLEGENRPQLEKNTAIYQARLETFDTLKETISEWIKASGIRKIALNARIKLMAMKLEMPSGPFLTGSEMSHDDYVKGMETIADQQLGLLRKLTRKWLDTIPG